jgi:hypothetical protein
VVLAQHYIGLSPSVDEVFKAWKSATEVGPGITDGLQGFQLNHLLLLCVTITAERAGRGSGSYRGSDVSHRALDAATILQKHVGYDCGESDQLKRGVWISCELN